MDIRIQNVLNKLKSDNLDCFIVSLPSNISYLTRSISRDSMLLVSKKESIYFTDFRYYEEAKHNFKNKFRVEKIDNSMLAAISTACDSLKAKRVGFEENHLTCRQLRLLKEKIGNKVELVPITGIIEAIREVKDKEELDKIKTATGITKKALEFAGRFLKPGVKEIEVAAELESFIRYNGARSAAFEIIVASGPNTSFAHHLTSQRVIKNNEPVLIDIGTDYMGYKSDLTRVFFLGRIPIFARKIYHIVAKAQDAAIAKIKPGERLNSIDKAARDVITKAGYGPNFGHSLGHGIGLEIHEKPTVSARNPDIILPGMVFTIEPAIYIANKFGIRLEDTVLATKKGVEVLSGSLNK
ncbi:MAG: Xaa-Pro peptidase family protein [Candidatus Omnitrophica bacterium]|nr:Xaa-Pro peptidase family protein [Candidatus Omnitrophota bacterium]